MILPEGASCLLAALPILGKLEVGALLLLAALVIPAGVIDWRTGEIPNRLTYSGMLAGLVYWTLLGLLQSGLGGAGEGLLASSLGLLAGFVPFAILFSLGGLGGGDVKLMGAVGALAADWHMVLAVAFYAFLFAALLSIVVMIRRRIVLQTLKRIFVAGFMAASRVAPQFPKDSPRIAFGAAVALGTLLAGAERWLGLTLPWTSTYR